MDATPHILRTGNHGLAMEFRRAVQDLEASLRRFGLAWALARHDIASRYRGSMLGPFWITLSMGVVVAGTGTLYSQLFRLDPATLLPYVAVGLVTWTFLASSINEGCESFTSAASILRQSSMPFFVFVWRTILRNLLTLAHHLLIIAVVLFFAGKGVGNVGVSLLGLLALILIATPAGMIAAVLSARFRDVPQVIQAVVQFMMFMTPIFWMSSQVGRHHYFLTWNPFYYMIDAVRSPLLGMPLDGRTWGVLTFLILATWVIAMATLTRTRRRIVHYL